MKTTNWNQTSLGSRCGPLRCDGGWKGERKQDLSHFKGPPLLCFAGYGGGRAHGIRGKNLSQQLYSTFLNRQYQGLISKTQVFRQKLSSKPLIEVSMQHCQKDAVLTKPQVSYLSLILK